jgi:hypothetical protein
MYCYTVVDLSKCSLVRPEKLQQAAPLVIGKWWETLDLTVSFLSNGSSREADRQRALDAMHEWERHCGIRFRAIEATANIRISFKEEGCWSVIGTDAAGVPPTKATMNLRPDLSFMKHYMN